MNCIVIILITILILLSSSKESLTARPDHKSKHFLAREILHNRSLFSGRQPNFDRARTHLTWLDPILYEDVRNLSRHNKLNKENIIKVLE